MKSDELFTENLWDYINDSYYYDRMKEHRKNNKELFAFNNQDIVLVEAIKRLPMCFISDFFYDEEDKELGLIHQHWKKNNGLIINKGDLFGYNQFGDFLVNNKMTVYLNGYLPSNYFTVDYFSLGSPITRATYFKRLNAGDENPYRSHKEDFDVDFDGKDCLFPDKE